MKRQGLDVKTVDALKPRAKGYRVSDGGGLLLDVRPSGAKVWLCRLTVDGARRDMGLGGYPLVTLAAARKAALEARRLAREGTDPIEERKRQAAVRTEERAAIKRAASDATNRTFRAVAEACITALTPGWKSTRTAGIFRATFERYIFPEIGDMPVAEVTQTEVMKAVQDVWSSRPGVARKLLQRVGTVLRYAAAHRMRANDRPADAKMLRHAGLPALAGGRKHPSLPWQRLPAFMQALAGMPGLAPLALRFAILTALRSGEVRGARWSELSFDGGPVWTVPGERMKGKRAADVQPHRVPLSGAAMDVLQLAYRVTTGAEVAVEDIPRRAAQRGDALIFPSAKLTTPLSDMALSAVVRRMNGARPEGQPAPWRDNDGREAVPHGFRATFRTWIDDTRPADAAAAEKALAHEETNKVVAAYRRSDLLDRRVPLMADWAAYCMTRAEGVTVQKPSPGKA